VGDGVFFENTDSAVARAGGEVDTNYLQSRRLLTLNLDTQPCRCDLPWGSVVLKTRQVP
jgi:hypothetical protein